MDYKKIIKNQKLRFAILRCLSWVPDRMMLKLQYYIKFGRKLDLKNPERFTEKIQHYKIYYRNPEMCPCSDKYRVREFVKQRIGEKYLNRLIGVYDSPDEIDFGTLPTKFVIKTTDGGGGENIIICRDRESLDADLTVSKLSSWKNKNNVSLSREWAYEGAKQSRIIIEELLEKPDDPEGTIEDFKFFCFSGQVRYIAVDIGRFGKRQRTIYDTDWVAQDVKSHNYLLIDHDFPKPRNLEEMISVAESLSEGFPFVRVDLYNIAGRIVFGEMTFYPSSGYYFFDPDGFDFEMGKNFNIDYAHDR